MADDTKVKSFRFRPFGTKGKVAVLTISHGGNKESTASSKPLPQGGTQKIAQRGGTTLKTVVYGGSGVNENDFPVKAPAGYHTIGINFGVQEDGMEVLYRANPTLNAKLTDDVGPVSRALPSFGQGVGKVALKEGQTVYGRIFFQVQDKRNPNSFSFRAFQRRRQAGVVLTIRRKERGGHAGRRAAAHRGTGLGTPRDPLPPGGIRKTVQHGGTTVKAVMYGGQGGVTSPTRHSPSSRRPATT